MGKHRTGRAGPPAALGRRGGVGRRAVGSAAVAVAKRGPRAPGRLVGFGTAGRVHLRPDAEVVTASSFAKVLTALEPRWPPARTASRSTRSWSTAGPPPPGWRSGRPTSGSRTTCPGAPSPAAVCWPTTARAAPAPCSRPAPSTWSPTPRTAARLTARRRQLARAVEAGRLAGRGAARRPRPERLRRRHGRGRHPRRGGLDQGRDGRVVRGAVRRAPADPHGLRHRAGPADRPGEVGLVPEYALLRRSPPPRTRRCWPAPTTPPCSATAGCRPPPRSPTRSARPALERLLAALKSPSAAKAYAAAGLRRPNADTAPRQRGPSAAAADRRSRWRSSSRTTSTTSSPPGMCRTGAAASCSPSTCPGRWASRRPAPSTPLIRPGAAGLPGGRSDVAGPVVAGAVVVRLPAGPAAGLPGAAVDRAADRRAAGRAAAAVNRLTAERTGTGLYDTILAAYKAATASWRADEANQVVVFTDGRNEDDPVSISVQQLATELKKAARPEAAGRADRCRLREAAGGVHPGEGGRGRGRVRVERADAGRGLGGVPARRRVGSAHLTAAPVPVRTLAG